MDLGSVVVMTLSTSSLGADLAVHVLPITEHIVHSQLAERFTSSEDFVSKSSFVSAAEGVNIISRLLVCKGDLVWRDTNDIAILFVKLALPVDQLASQETVDERQSRPSLELGPGESTGKLMEEEIVDVGRHRILERS